MGLAGIHRTATAGDAAGARAALVEAAALGSNWSLHDLRHSAAYRMARDPGVPLTDALSTTPGGAICN